MHPDQVLLDRLSETLDETIRQALDGASDVAMVNFPNHANPGDSALWLGAKASLRQLGVRVRYQCVWDTFSERALRRALPDGPVLLNGGGNFGDLYQGQQNVRERLLGQLRSRRLIQLPQSMHFRERTNLERNRRLVADHGRVTLIARESQTEQQFRDLFDADVLLAPDAAFGLRRLTPPSQGPEADLLWLHRVPGDAEFVDHGTPPEGTSAITMEWLHPQGSREPHWTARHRLARAVNARIRGRAAADPRWASHAWRPLAATLDPLGAAYTRRGVELLGTGRLVVTDKLHGHILALLAGIRHIVLDNSYGKVSATYRTWTHPSTVTSWADTGDVARDLAAERLVHG